MILLRIYPGDQIIIRFIQIAKVSRRYYKKYVGFFFLESVAY